MNLIFWIALVLLLAGGVLWVTANRLHPHPASTRLREVAAAACLLAAPLIAVGSFLSDVDLVLKIAQVFASAILFGALVVALRASKNSDKR